MGRCEITIQPWLEKRLHDLDWTVVSALGNLVRHMFLTQPPCKALGIYIFDGRIFYIPIQPLARICHTDGIRIGDLLTEIQQHLPTTMEQWRTDAVTMRRTRENLEWTA